MLNESCTPVISGLVAEGRMLPDRERMAFFLALPVVLLLAMMGYAAPADLYRVLPEPGDAEPCSQPGSGIVCMRGILPAGAGTAGRWTRTVFQD